MKRSTIILSIVALSALLSTTKAAPVPFPQDGDLFMGFHSTTATNEYLWDIGQYSQFTPGTPVVVGNIGSDLVSVFGAGWATNPDAQWGSAGVLSSTSMLFATKNGPDTTTAVPWDRQSTASQDNTGSTINTMIFGDYAGQEASPNNPTAVIHTTGGLSWTSYQNGANSPGSSFNAWVPTIEAPTIPGVGNSTGILNTRLDLFQIDPDNGGTNPPSQYIGSFTIDVNGTVSYGTFAEPTPTPTPSPTPSATPTPTISPTPTPTATPSPTPSATPTPTISPTPTPTATPSPTPSATPSADVANISTRLAVGTGDNVLIGGFIINGTGPKNVIVRAIGPTLPVDGAMADPTLTIYDISGTAIATNDDWMTNTNKQDIIDSNLAPSNDKESALLLPLQPGAYTAILQGKDGTTGVALLEIYDLEAGGSSQVANISTRGFVQTGDGVMIAGVIITGEGGADVLVRGIGPSLPLPNALLDPSLEIYNSAGMLIFSNDDWMDTQKSEIDATGLAPSDDKESAVLTTLTPGLYTALLRGVDGTTGNALVEVYHLTP